MPAIQPARLRKQVIELVDLFEQPNRFLSHLHDLFELYASRAHRLTQGATALTLLPRFDDPPAVIHQVENELYPYCQSNPLSALKLADDLWADSYLEVRLLAIYLLGVIPLPSSEPVIERLFAWIQAVDDEQLLNALLEKGALRVRRSQPALWWKMVQDWLSNPDVHLQLLGLRALASLAADETFNDLPAVFVTISPLISPFRPELKLGLEAVLRALSRRSPAETVYFLKQVLSLSSDPSILRLARYCLPFIDIEWRASLQALLRGEQAAPGNPT